MKIILAILFISLQLFANQSLKKQELNQYKLALVKKHVLKYKEAQKGSSIKKRNLVKDTLLCIANARSGWEIKDCKVNERKKIMNIIAQKKEGKSYTNQKTLNLITPYKKELISRYYSYLKNSKSKKAKGIHRSAIICIQDSHSLKKLNACEKYHIARINKLDKYSHRVFFVEKKNLMLQDYKYKYYRTRSINRKYYISQTINCLQDSFEEEDLYNCKKNDSLYLSSLIKSFEDNPRLLDIVDTQDLIDRYKIRIEIAKLDNASDKIKIFNKTLSCLQSYNKDISTCKKEEKERISAILRY